MTAILQKKKLRPTFLPPLSADGPVNLQDVEAIIFRNAGTATVNFQGGAYTLDSKETVSLNVTDDASMLQIEDVMVTFDTTTGDVKKLQIIILKASNC